MNNYIVKESNIKDMDIIIERLVEYNLSKVPLKQDEAFIWINRIIENAEGEIVAGIIGKLYCWNCLYIDALWVKEDSRKHGLGSRLLEAVENVAKEKGCYLIHLDTFDFQGKDFYIKHRYEVFGVLEDCPEGHKRYFMKKNLKLKY